MKVILPFILMIFALSATAESALNEVSPEIRELIFLSQKPCNEVNSLPESRSAIIISGLINNRESIKSMDKAELDDFINNVRKLCSAFPNQSFYDLVNYSK
ncbi:hypothetical protein [Endozoicomonas acroporae]|uniref:hypothetical protein n=1 Tax=Endozoicomonas acroporae TaxID=1701104 RepID=UPI003D78E5BB